MTIAIFYLLAIASAQLVTALVNPIWGIAFHTVLLFSLIFHAAFTTRHPDHKLYLALSLAPLIAILSLTMPLAQFSQIYQYLIISIPLLAAAYAVIRILSFQASEIGLRVRKIPLQGLVALTGIGLGLAEYQILRPEPMVDALSWASIWLPALILVVATGFVEELVFRGVMQRSSLEVLGRWGLIYAAGLFSVLYIGYLSAAQVGFAFLVGLFFGWIVKKTGSLLGVALSHGITNVALYLVIPFVVQ